MAHVVFAGNFVGGSFGKPGSVLQVYTYWLVKCRETSRTYPAIPDNKFWFLDESEAQKFAIVVSEQERKEDIADEKAKAEAKQAVLDAAIRVVTAAAEEWMPGRVAVRQANDGGLIVGRWDEPYTPGYGLPAEVRRPVSDGSKCVLVACHDSYRHTFG